ncbi:MAG TPA: S1 RNA-binding domain-containing protein [Myxococcota bacterium]|nr:S1 RNA-binding domain-containing protein [Myxococcota bacterium]
MNVEMNKESEGTPPQEAVQPGGHRKKKKRSNFGAKKVRESVTYSKDELSAVEGQPFWNALHDGIIKSLSEDGLLVSVTKSDAGTLDVYVPKDECVHMEARKEGQEIRLYVDDTPLAEHPISGSEKKAIDLDLLEKAALAKEAHNSVPGYVIGTIKGGYCVALFAKNRDEAEKGAGLRAFLPLGLAGLRRSDSLGEDQHMIDLQISDFDPVMGNIVVSRRELLAEGQKRGREEFFAQHKIGDTVSGKVTALMPYGAFVSLGAVDGFLHISDISWDKKPRIKDIVPVGKEISAQIIELDEEKKKVKLSIKGLNADPWQTIEKTFRPGTEVNGTIVAFAEFGAFVKLQDGVEGLIHVGEITWNRIKHPSQYFKIGDQVKAAVLRVDKEARRISLSTKALALSPVERLSAQFPVGAVIKTRVASIHDFGLFVELDEESNGLVPRSEVSWLRSEEPLDQRYSVGQEIEVAVLGYDSNRQRVSCSIKRLSEDPWIQWKQKYKKGSVHKLKVQQVSRAGVVCELEGGLTAFCAKNQLAEESNEQGRVNAKVGDTIEVVVTACDPMHQRISISQRAQVESETKQAYASYLSEQGKSGARTTLGDAFKKLELNKGKK